MTRSRHSESKNASGTTTRSDPDSDTNRLRALVTTAGRLLGDALVLGLWTLFVTLLVLAGGWPGWLYYSLLLGGVVVYVSITVPWTGAREKLSN
ncbi:hypothetical protein OB919_09705 [Halobacteria archaeon AArc-curdl1]|uniref:DUF8119 domain-containing protein n=1 Tax=Natronosalvus hydrolyticus TaxID=2979988 RepID=A0AAP2Z8K9_9EURY|nr:hypothetical protein [Halobacteria archaeon AArc-curdl1]